MRHGPTHEKAFVGWRDVPADLSDQAAITRLADYLPKNAAVVSSDLSRARTTADAIARDRLRLADDPRLREFNFGVWDGLRFSEVAERDPELSRAFWEQPGDIAPPEGESWNTVAHRVAAAVDDLVEDHSDTPICIVAHIGVIMTQIARAQRKGAYAAMAHEIDNLSVTEVVKAPTGWTLGAINHKP